MDLSKEALKEPEVATGDAFDGGDGLRVGEVVGVECLAELASKRFEDEGKAPGSLGHVAEPFLASYRLLKCGWSLFDRRCEGP